MKKAIELRQKNRPIVPAPLQPDRVSFYEHLSFAFLFTSGPYNR